MIKAVTVNITELPCNCHEVASFTPETFSWSLERQNNVWKINVKCMKCNAFLEGGLSGYLHLAGKEKSDSIAQPSRKFPITIREAKAAMDAYLASLPEEEVEVILPKKEYIH